MPRLGGATADDLASRYVGKSAGAAEIHALAVKLGFTDPIWVQYGRFVKGVFVGADYNTGPTTEHCPAPCLGYSFINQNPVLPDLLDRLPVTLSLAAGAAVLWLVGGVSIGVLSALRAGSVLRPRRRWASRSPACRCRSSSPACCRCRSSATAQVDDAGGATSDGRQSPLDLGARPAPAVDHARVPLRRRRTPDSPGPGMLETMNEDYIRTARAKGLPERDVVVKHGLRSALTPILTIFGLDLGLLLGGAILTESTYSLPGIGKYAVQRDHQQRPAQGARRDAVRRIFVVIANLVVDLLYAVIDPRVRV